MCYSISKREKNLRYVCIFFHYAYFRYGQQLGRDQQFMAKLREIYEDTKRELSEETIAAIVNLCMVMEGHHENRAIIEENSITVFKEYQAQVAVLNFNRIVSRHPHEEWVIDYLRYSIRLLHFLRAIKTAEDAEPCKYYTPNFPLIAKVDAFKVVSDMLDFLKCELEPVKYDRLIEGLN